MRSLSSYIQLKKIEKKNVSTSKLNQILYKQKISLSTLHNDNESKPSRNTPYPSTEHCFELFQFIHLMTKKSTAAKLLIKHANFHQNNNIKLVSNSFNYRVRISINI